MNEAHPIENKEQIFYLFLNKIINKIKFATLLLTSVISLLILLSIKKD